LGVSNPPGINLPEEVRGRLRAEIDRQYGSQRSAAGHLGISHHHLSAILCDRSRASWDLASQLAAMLGLELTITVKRRHPAGTLPLRPDRRPAQR
jgi:DNA-binding XRE family transcriptional regulator